MFVTNNEQIVRVTEENNIIRIVSIQLVQNYASKFLHQKLQLAENHQTSIRAQY